MLCDYRFSLNREDRDILSRGVRLDFGPPGGGGVLRDFRFTTEPTVQDTPEQVLICAQFATGARSYAITPESLRRGAIKRLLGVRDNNPAYHQGLVANQAATVLSAGPCRFRDWYHRRLLVMDAYMVLQDAWLNQSHPKRELRWKEHDKALRKGIPLTDNRKYVDYKLKPQELLAPGKQLRCIGEISGLSAFEHGPLADIHKKVMCESFVYRCGSATFIPGPQEESLDRAFKLLTEANHKVNFIYFSDDACVSVRCTDGLFMANLDLSWSDGSMFAPEFEYAQSVLAVGATAEVVRQAFRQCQKPIRLVNRRREGWSKRRHKKYQEYIQFRLNPGHYCLPSGFSGTTLMNNFSQVLLFSRLVDAVNRRGHTKAQMRGIIERAAGRAGLVVKADVCKHYEDLQFLKHSWAMTDEGYKPYVGLACWVRGWGVVKGHLPGKKGMDLESRFRAFMGEVVEGRRNWGSTPLSDVFEEVYPRVGSELNFTPWLSEDMKRSSLKARRFDAESICRRYRISSAVLDDFCDIFRRSRGFAARITHPLVDAVMKKDYGYEREYRVRGLLKDPLYDERRRRVRDWSGDQFAPYEPTHSHRRA